MFTIRVGRHPSAACMELTLGSLPRPISPRLPGYLGDASGGAAQFEEASSEALASEHPPTIAITYTFRAAHEMVRGDSEATTAAGNVLLDVAERNGLGLYGNLARMFLDWTRARLGAADGLAQFRDHRETTINQGARLSSPLFHGRLAELEADQMSLDEALTSIDRAIELARKGDIRYIDALLHRIRGDILLRRDPANAAPAEEAYLTAIAVAREQGARSFGLQAALKLAKLYQSTARPVEAHDILAPALEGFAPTPEMQEIAEAQALLAALADTDEWKSAAAARERRLKLQTSYGQAMGYLKGFAAEETKAVLAQTLGLAAQSGNVAERMKAHYARWIALYTGGELKSAHEAAEGFLREAKLAGDAPAVAYAARVLGQTCLFQGRFAEAREHLREALRVYSPGWDASVRRQLGSDARDRRQGLSRHGRLARRRCDRRRRAIRSSVDRGARFRTCAHDRE